MSRRSFGNRLQCTTAIGGAVGALMGCGLAAADDAHNMKTDTPIKHLIVLIGENRSFDNVYATYQPKNGHSVANLLSKGIVSSSGALQPGGPVQYYLTAWPTTYFIDARTLPKTLYATLPPPNTAYVPTSPGPLSQGQGPFDSADVPNSELPTIEPSIDPEDLGLLRTGASGLPMFSTDTRVANATALPDGSFQITNPTTLPYDSYTGDMVHRLFHMWQQSDCDVLNATPANPSGCLNDLYPFVGVARADGSGGNSMGFLNVQNGDAPLFKQIADRYTLNDNYHQPVMGGTAVQHIMIGTADAIFWETFQGASQPPAASIANPDPTSPTNVAFKNDKAWTNCSDLTQPGIPAIVNYLKTLPWKPAPNCAAGHFYMINNLSPGYLPNGNVDSANILTGAKVPPS